MWLLVCGRGLCESLEDVGDELRDDVVDVDWSGLEDVVVGVVGDVVVEVDVDTSREGSGLKGRSACVAERAQFPVNWARSLSRVKPPLELSWKLVVLLSQSCSI